jgi:aspartyl-tRNA synthetase
VTKEWPRIPYADAIRTYGSDKPDLRNPIKMQAVTEHFRGSGFKIFANMIANDPTVEVWAIPAKTGGNRAFCGSDEFLGAKRGPAGPRLYLLQVKARRVRSRSARQKHWSGTYQADPRISFRLASAMPASSSGASLRTSYKFAGACAQASAKS